MNGGNVNLTKTEAQIVTDVLLLVMNDSDWQELASASDEEWAALDTACTKIWGVSR